ncbi:hypothetical protein [Leucobacter triazinivorans]|uniref:EccD-like transmembrane domain-containing protein n=1 Tax=Leucobacter triazinivorans TaxID=1784719 RepID=A0A4P6KGJ1_9MICO|nr:hypothetical protein [Leucobacter triazinivorans]QBE49380.1 hypothetical protein EVS81_11480 [Leucobacter triazinivorans]
MSQPSPQLRRIALDAGGRRHDLAVPAGDALAAALAAVGVHLGDGQRVLGPDGTVVDTGTPMTELREGGLYAVAGGAAAAPRGGGAGAGGAVAVLPWALGGLALVSGILALGADGWRWPAAAVLGLAAVAALLAAGRARPGRVVVVAAFGLGGLAAALATTAGAGAGADPGADPGLLLAVAAVAVTVTAGVLMVVAEDDALRAAATPIVVISALFSVLALLSPALRWTPPQLLIAASAAAVIGIRAAPSLLVGVDPGYHLDYGRYMVLRWTVRGRVPEFIERVDEDRVRSIVAASEARLRSAIVLLSVIAAAGLPSAAQPLGSGDPVAAIAAAVYVATAVLALLLTSRRTSSPALRLPPRLAVLTGLLGLAALLAPRTPALAATVAAAALLLAALVAAGMIAPLARGDRSLGWSRAGDIVDSIAIAVVLPAGLLAAGTLHLLRGVLSA